MFLVGNFPAERGGGNLAEAGFQFVGALGVVFLRHEEAFNAFGDGLGGGDGGIGDGFEPGCGNGGAARVAIA